MLITESRWLKRAIEVLELPAGTKVLNFGSQRLSALRYQNYIKENVYHAIAQKKFQLINFDLLPGEGVDISGNIMEDDVFNRLLKEDIRAIFIFNVLEHVNERAAICARIEQLLPDGGYILVSVPYRYPIHNDPIDNNFRPTPSEVNALFSSCESIQGEVIPDHTYLFYLSHNIRTLIKFMIRIFTPFYKFENWKTQVALLPYLFKKFQVTIVVLKKS